MSYRAAVKLPKQGNTERCIVLRQQYAMVILPLLELGQRIVNVDESWLAETSFIRKMWSPKKDASSISTKFVAPRLSLLAAIDTEGRSWFALT